MLFAVSSLGAFAILAILGARQDEMGLRVLAELDAPYDWLRDTSAALYLWTISHTREVGWAVAIGAGLAALLGLASNPRAALPLSILGGAVCAAAWGQVLLLHDQVHNGIALYVLGVAGAFLLALVRPLRRVAGFPGGDPKAVPPIAWWEWLTLSLLTAIAMLVRVHGLNERPDFFEVEMVATMVQSATLAGTAAYAGDTFFTNSTGIVHFPVQWLMFQLAGHSPYAIRLAAALMGTACVPVFYFLVRRLAGAVPAVAGTLLYLSAPEQVFWSRSETTIYIAVSLLTLVTAHTSLWLIESRTWRSGLMTALCMASSRLFYHGGIVMFLVPVAMYLHTLIFVRGAWRSAHRIVPWLLLGIALWAGSLTLMKSIATGTFVPFINPVIVSGHAPWAAQGAIRDEEPLAIAEKQVRAITAKLAIVATNMMYRSGFSHWYLRVDPSRNPTITNVALIVLVALGLGYLLGQIQDPRAFALLFWIGVGLLPGVLSLEPADRRIAAVFPALPVVAAIVIAAATRLARAAGRLAGGVAAFGACIATLAIALASLASQWLLPMQPLDFAALMRAARPLLNEGDIVLHDLQPEAALTIALGSLDVLSRDRPPCFASIAERDPIAVVTDPTCDYDSYVHRQSHPPARLAKWDREPRPIETITFLTSAAERSDSVDALLRLVYPEAQRRDFRSRNDEFSFRATTVTQANVTAVRSVRVRVAPERRDTTEILASVPATVIEADTADPSLRISGGFVTAADAWATLSVKPSCPEASLWVNGARQDGNPPVAMARGAQRFEILLPPNHHCALPLELALRRVPGAASESVLPSAILAPDIAAKLQHSAAPTALYSGYRPAATAIEPSDSGVPADFGVDARGSLIVAMNQGSDCLLRRYTADLQLDPFWEVRLPRDLGCVAVAVAPDGTTAVFGYGALALYDASAQPLRHMPFPLDLAPEAAFAADGRLFVASPPEGGVMTLAADGSLERSALAPPGKDLRFQEPIAAATGPDGELFVAQGNGRIFVYRLSASGSAQWIATAATMPLSRFSGGSFEGVDRILLANPHSRSPEVYATDGTRLIASEAHHDLGSLVPHVRRFRAAGNRLFVLDTRGAIHVLERVP